MRYTQTRGEVAPPVLISRHRRRTSSCPQLDTIVEEECDDIRVPKRVYVLLPILFSLSLILNYSSDAHVAAIAEREEFSCTS
ncbi:hypothetical protein V6N13_011343 [Hibiscus sabdariffa]